MRKVMFTMALLFSLQSFGQKVKEVKTPELYVEPQSIQVVNHFWKLDSKDNKKNGITMVIGGITMVGLDTYNVNYVKKRPTTYGWVYKPVILEITPKIILSNK